MGLFKDLHLFIYNSYAYYSKRHLSKCCYACCMCPAPAQELSVTEKRVLIALRKLKGFGTPEQLQEAMLPEEIAQLSSSLNINLDKAFSDAGISISDNQRARLIEAFLKDCMIVDEKLMKGAIMSILITQLSNPILSQDVPGQRNIIGKLLGDCMPAIVGALRSIMDSGDAVFVSQVEVMNACSWLRSKELLEMSEKLEKYYSLISKRTGQMDLPERRAIKAMKQLIAVSAPHLCIRESIRHSLVGPQHSEVLVNDHHEVLNGVKSVLPLYG